MIPTRHDGRPLAGGREPGRQVELLARMTAGEPQAWRTFHQRYFPLVAGFLRKLGLCSPDLERACQEVFLEANRGLPRLPGDAPVRPWMYGLCLVEFRRVRRRRRLARTLLNVFRSSPSPADSASDSADGARALVLRALDEMDDTDRAAFVLFEMEGAPGPEIADIMRCPLPQVWRHVHDARLVLKRALGSDSVGPRS